MKDPSVPSEVIVLTMAKLFAGPSMRCRITGAEGLSAVKVITTDEPAAIESGTLLIVRARADEAKSKVLMNDLQNILEVLVFLI